MTRAAKLSLREFYEHHGKPVEASLPKKSGDGARDVDQSHSTRLADLSLDTRKSYRGPRVDDAGYGQGASRVDVDYDYYGAPRHQGYVPHQSGYGRSRAPLAGGAGHADPAAAATALMAAGEGRTAPMQTTSAPYSSAGPSSPGPHGGTYAGAPKPMAAAGEDVWYPPPPPPPPRRGSPTALLQAKPAAPCAGMRPVPTSTNPVGSFAVPAPPPPRAKKHVQGAPQVQTVAAATQPACAGLAPEVALEGPASAATTVTVETQAQEDSKVAKAEEVALEVKAPPAAAATPFAAAGPAVPAGPRNEFAEKLAAMAIANAAKAKSSLLAGSTLTGSTSLTSAMSAGSPTSNEESSGTFLAPAHAFGRPRLNLKPRTVPLADSTTVTPSGGNTSSSSASSECGTDVAEKDSTVSVASSAAGRPRLQLQPRTLPVAQEGSSNVTATDASGRPRLNLLPRGSSGMERVGSTPSEEAKRKPSVFGAAKPREEVLKERGVDPADLERLSSAASGATRLSEAAVAKLGGSHASTVRIGGSHSSISGVDDEWQVAGHGRKGSSKLGYDVNGKASVLLGDDPFFGTSSKSYNVPAPRAFDRDIMRDNRGHSSRASGSFGDDGYGSYGKKGGYFGSPARNGWGGKGDAADDDWDGDVFSRALPTRQAPLAL